MQFIGYTKSGSLAAVDFNSHQGSKPTPNDLEVLVEIKAIGLNPIDYKIRQSRSGSPEAPVILGWDASGVISHVGAKVKNFNPGDEVFYSGDLTKNGSYATHQCIDHRLIAKKPKTLSFAQAAALPLTSLTAYEMLFEKMKLTDHCKKVILVVGGAGGVGSMATQLLKAKTKAAVIATASRKESIDWVKKLGADHVIPHEHMGAQIRDLGFEYVDSIFCTTHSHTHFTEMTNIVAPFGEIGLIEEPETLNLSPLKKKAITLHLELMFAKPLNHYKEESQGQILGEVAQLVDTQKIVTTSQLVLNGLTIENICAGHRLLESHQSVGKIVVTI